MHRSRWFSDPRSQGLTNEDLDRCQMLLTIPTDPTFSSLNLAMAVQVVTYELRQRQLAPDRRTLRRCRLTTMCHWQPQPSSSASMRHLEATLTHSGFLDPDNPRLLMRRLRRLFARALPDQNEVNILARYSGLSSDRGDERVGVSR